MVDATTSAVVEPSLPPVMMPLPLRRQPLAAEIASQRDAVSETDLGDPIRTHRSRIQPSVGVVADVVAARAVDAVVEAKDARTVTL